MSKTQTSIEILGVDPDELWKKLVNPLLQRDLLESPEEVALRIIEKKLLTQRELALLSVVAVDALIQSGAGS